MFAAPLDTNATYEAPAGDKIMSLRSGESFGHLQLPTGFTGL